MPTADLIVAALSGYIAGLLLYPFIIGRLTMPNNRNEFTREQVRSQVSDAIGGDKISYRLTDAGEPFILDHPLFRTKELEAALEPLAEDDADAIS